MRIGIALMVGCLVLSGTLATGCSSARMVRNDITVTRARVDSLSVLLTKTNVRLDKHYELMRLLRADQQNGFNEIERVLSAVAGGVTESQTRLSSIAAKTEELRSGWEQLARTDSTASAARQAEVDGLFKVAMSDFQSGKRELALSGFNDIVVRYSDFPQAEDALYWIGECHFAEKNYSLAINAYTDYMRKYPDGRNQCATLYKTGLVYDRARNPTGRDMAWDQLLNLCATSEEAAIVTSRRQQRKK